MYALSDQVIHINLLERSEKWHNEASSERVGTGDDLRSSHTPIGQQPSIEDEEV